MNARLPRSALTPNTLPTIEKETTVFMSGNSQAVRIPKEFQLKTKQVRIIQRGDDLVIKPKYKTTAEILANLPPLSAEDEADGFDLAAIVGESNKKVRPERDLSRLFAEALRKTRGKAVKAAA
jgi:antitoxin VapB